MGERERAAHRPRLIRNPGIAQITSVSEPAKRAKPRWREKLPAGWEEGEVRRGVIPGLGENVTGQQPRLGYFVSRAFYR